MGVVAASLAISAVVYLPAGIAEAPSAWPSGQAVLAVLTLAVVCTAVAFLVFFRLIAEVGAGPLDRDHLRQPGRRGAARRAGAGRVVHGRDRRSGSR